MDELLVGEFLAHYGVKGQKWGVRRARESSGSGEGSSRGKIITKKRAIVGGAAAASVVLGPGLLPTAAIAGGAVLVTKLMKKHGTTPMAELHKAKNSVANKINKKS